MSHEVITKAEHEEEESVAEAEEPKRSRYPEVTKERIERVKKAFRSSWLIDMINSSEKNSSGKKPK